MSAYATPNRDSLQRSSLSAISNFPVSERAVAELPPRLPEINGAQLIDALVIQLADRVATAIAERLGAPSTDKAPEWLDSREAADYLGLHRDTLRKLAAERAIPAEQEGPGCKLFFRRSALDEWRLTGGRSAQLASSLAQAA